MASVASRIGKRTVVARLSEPDTALPNLARFAPLIALVLLAILPTGAIAEVTTVVDSLTQPGQLVVLPGSSRRQQVVLLIESGTGRLLRYVSTLPGRAQMVHEFGDVKATSLAVLGRDRLVVGVTQPDGSQQLVVFSLTKLKPELKQTIELEASLSDVASLAINKRHVFVSTGNQIYRVRHNAGMLGTPKLFAELPNAKRITGLAFDSKRYLLVLSEENPSEGERGPVNLHYLSPDEAEEQPRMTLATGLLATAGLVVGVKPQPIDRLLYAAGTLADESQAGLFRLDAKLDVNRQMQCQPTLVAEAAGLQAITNGSDGSIYATTTANSTDGKLLKIIQEP